MKNSVKIQIALATACLGLTSINTVAAGAGIDILIANTGYDRIASVFDPESGVLYVAGTDKDNTIEVSAARDGLLLVNDGEVRIEGGSPTLKNTRLVVMSGGAGNDLLISRRLPQVAMIGGDGADVLFWDNGDGVSYGDEDVDANDFVVWRRTIGTYSRSSDQTKLLGGWFTTADTVEFAKGVVGGWGSDWYTCGTGQDAPSDSEGFLLTDTGEPIELKDGFDF